jgi:signal transduction histidine kinase
MIDGRQLARILPVAALLALIGLASLGFIALKKDSEALDQVSKENIVWAATQLETEHLRFTNALGLLANETEDFRLHEIPRRFDILWSRAAQFGEGEVGDRLARYDRGAQVIPRLNALLRQHEPTLERLLRGDHSVAHVMASDFTALQADLHELSVRVVRGEEARLGGARERQRESVTITTLASAVALVFGVVIVFYLYTQVSRFEKLARANLRLAQKAQRADESKTRFLTMMSHELRTPMNGVLGTLDLIAQSELTRPQRRLVDQAGRSGRYMIRMLSDLIDVSSLKADNPRPDVKPTSVGQIARAVDEQFAHMARREGVRATTQVEDPRLRIEIDAQRLQQALNYVLEHLVARVGATDLQMRLWAQGASLYVAVRFLAARSDISDPELEVLAKEPAHALNDIASDAFGPSVARDVIAFLDGAIAVRKLGPRSGQVLITLPVRVMSERAPLSMRLEVRSHTMRALCETVVLRTPEVVLCEKNDGAPDVVLAEIGGEDEPAQAARLRQTWPSALILAFGAARNPQEFDAVIEGLFTPAELRDAVAQAAKARGLEKAG